MNVPKRGLTAQAGAYVAAGTASKDKSNITAVPEASQVYEYAPGEEPYRAVGVDVNEAEVLDVAARAQVSKAQDQYSKMYREARVIEDARHAAAGGVNPQGKAISKRPDLVARTKMEKAGATVNTRKVAGHLPGIAIFDRFYLRAEMGVVGMHFSPLGGIDYISKSAIAGCPQYATSIMVCGGYEDDADDGHELTYTGQGGNDLLGNRQQNGEQQLRLGNLALVGNIQLGIPVRVTRRNIEQDAICGAVFIYDGLYNVVKYWLEKGKKGLMVKYWLEKGKKGFSVYKYLLRRRPDQGDLATSRVEFGGKSAPKGLSALTRPGVFDVDISCGKEPGPIVGVNEVNEEVVPFSEANQILTEQDMKGNPLTHLITEGARASHKRALEYITSSIPVQGGVQPTVPVLPAKMTRCPHTYLEYLNGGLLPYHDRSAGSKVKHSQARRVQSVLYECGPWANCPDGPACCQAASQQGCQYRLEVFQTSNKGWGIRSWDTIPNGAFVMNYTGKTKAIDEVGDDDMNYTFDLAPRPYSQGDEELPLFPKSMWETHKQAKYILDAKHEGNVARFINHSCDPNLYVQPVLSHHHDISQTQVCLFAGHNIAPMTELTFDYGHGFLKDNLKGNCNCGTAMCVGPDIKHQIEEEEQEEECRETEKEGWLAGTQLHGSTFTQVNRMSNLTRAELVQLAQTNLEGLAYLGNVSEQLLPAVDVACVIDQDILPVHSYVLMAASPVFAELVAAHFARIIKGDHQPEVITVPLPDTTTEAVKVALQYLYEQILVRAVLTQRKRARDYSA
ncbi:hypothetical protein WJX82_010636 [Trebouxia sp. C0006]